MVDHHVDRPGVEVRQRTQLTGPNHPIEFNPSSPTPIHSNHLSDKTRYKLHHAQHQNQTFTNSLIGWTTWWLWRGAYTRSHLELGRENPQRPWYCVSRHGRVGRRQVLQPIPQTTTTHAGWSSPVARQAHNLKAAGSNPAPATKLS